jgi:3-oxoacyl-[acyl-carrier-protein] synthase I
VKANCGAEILGLGIVTAVGLSAGETARSVRAGISGGRATPHVDLRDESILMAYLPDEVLPPLVDEVQDHYSFSDRQGRMISLAGLALAEALESIPVADPIALFLAVPDAPSGQETPAPPELLDQIALQAKVKIDRAKSALFAHDRAGGMTSLQQALERLAQDPNALVVVGGVDSFLDPMLLLDLDEAGRLKTPNSFDGFRPGEAAAFFVLGSSGMAQRLRTRLLGRIDALGLGIEPGHRGSEKPYRGDGLAAAFSQLFANAGTIEPVQSVYGGLNGEHLGAKEWGVALARQRDRLAPDFRFDHPLDCLGDVGAATGAVLIVLATMAMDLGHRGSPCIVWCSSDREQRGAALLRKA